ncbi:uncharacterized protein LOC103507496 [Diaphorina citri]|uniref:Uncharacterized protein LOC103507496 n=1 Tax=Diaphorina citri TaxID=121845 RepID=A0A3Q0IPB3_DIACI|nr:uncharacterized protein LOC103507496 [Diaphorina citri]
MDQFSILAFLFFFMSFHLSTTVCYLRSGYNDTKLAKDFDSPFLTRLFRIKRNQMQDGNRMFINEKARKYNHIDDEVLNWKIDESDSDEWNENEMVLRSRYKRSTSRKISKPAEIHSIDSLDEVLKEQIASVGNIGGMEDSWKFISNSEIPRFKSSDNLWQNFEHVENIDMTQEHEHEHSSIQHIRVPRDISQQNLAALINDNEAEGNKIKSNNGSYQPKLVAIQLIPIAIDANTANVDVTNKTRSNDPSNEPISQNSSNVIKEDPSVNIAEQMDKDDLITKLRNRKNTVEANKLAYTLLDDLIKNTTTPSPDDSNENSAIENLLHLSIYNISEYFSNSNSKVALLTVDNATETVGNATEKTIMEFIFGNWIDGHVDSKINDSIRNQTERHNLTTSTTTETPKPKDKKTMLDFILGNWVYDQVDSKINDSLQAESHNATTPVRLQIVNYSHTKDINNTNGNQQEQDLQVNKSTERFTDGVWQKNVKLAMDGFFIEMVDMVKYYTLKSIYSTTKILKKAAHMTAQFLNGVEEQVRNNTLVNKTAENIKAIQNTDMDFVKNTTGKIVQNNFDLMKNATGKILDNNLSLYGNTYICLSAPTDGPSSVDAVNPNTNVSKLAAEAAANATQLAQNKYNSVPGLLNQINEFGTSSLGSFGNAAIDAANNLGNLASNAVGQLINTFGMATELLGFLSGGLVTTSSQIASQIGQGVGGALNSTGKIVSSNFKEYSSLVSRLGSQTLSTGGKTAASALGASGNVHLSTRDYTWEG